MKISHLYTKQLLSKIIIAISFILTCTSFSVYAKPLVNPNDVLIVYLSRTNNTKTVADIISKSVEGSTLLPIELKTPYPDGYSGIASRVIQENSDKINPELTTSLKNIDKYKVIFIGFPTWMGQLPPPVRSFITKYKFKGKTIIPFNTNSGNGIGRTFSTLKSMLPDNKFLEGFSTRGGKEAVGLKLTIKGERKDAVKMQVIEWLKSIKVIN